MKSKTLALISGIVGLVGGILLLIGPFVLLGTAVNTAATTLNGGATAGAVSGVALLLNALKIANLVLGIIAIVYYKGDNRVGAAPSVLMIVSGGVSLIPFLGWVGGDSCHYWRISIPCNIEEIQIRRIKGILA